MAIKEHPIPQNITTYKFRLVGNMTLAQFLEVLAGIAIAFVFWKSPLYPILKYPLALLFGSGGALVAFVPLEERPLDVWLTSFIKKIYRPTLFIYTSLSHQPFYQTYQPPSKKETSLLTTTNKLNNFFKGQPSSISASQDEMIHKYVDQLFQEEVVPVTTSTPSSSPKPKVKPASSSVHPQQKTPLPIKPITPPQKTLVKKKEKEPLKKKVITSSKPSKPKVETKSKPQSSKPVSTTIFTSPKQVKKPAPLKKPTLSPPVKKTPPPAAAPTFDNSLPKPTKPNLPSGMVVDTSDHPVVGAIVEIKDANGLPLRVTKTNLIGQFTLVTPLPSGEYFVYLEKDGYQAEPVKLTLKGKIVEPLKIVAKEVKGA